MLKSYLIIAIRNLLRHKIYSTINILGLAVGMACCILMLLYVRYELSYDQNHTNADRIFSVVREDISEINSSFSRNVSGAFPLALKDAFPEVKHAIRVGLSRTWIYAGTQGFSQRLCVADPEILEMFTFPLTKGSRQTVLRNPDTVLITESTAQKFFGDANPIGQELKIEGRWGGFGDIYIVEGVLKDIPQQTTFRFDVLTSTWKNRPDRGNWLPNPGTYRALNAYVMLSESEESKQLEQKLPNLINQYLGKAATTRIAYHLQPLSHVYLYNLSEYGQGTARMSQIYLLTTLAGLILLIACVNFINLTTAQSINRSKEVGMRKVVYWFKVNGNFHSLT